jgi:secreted trypsin-like serine protease
MKAKLYVETSVRGVLTSNSLSAAWAYISSSTKLSFCFARARAPQYFLTACSCFLSTNPFPGATLS